jgi:hypothetical protein
LTGLPSGKKILAIAEVVLFLGKNRDEMFGQHCEEVVPAEWRGKMPGYAIRRRVAYRMAR